MTHPRGSVGIAVIVALVFLQLAVAGFVILEGREQDTTIQRLDSSRAFYAAEGAMNMAIRELISYADDDNDGQAGGISNDSNAADDPQIGTGAWGVAARQLVAGGTTIAADGRAGICRRHIVATIADGTTSGRRAVYSQWPNQTPQVRIWNGAGWGSATSTMGFGGKQYWALIRRCPIRQEVTIFCSTQGNNAVAAVESNGTWGNLVTASADCGTINTRPLALAYEQVSGNCVLAYRSGNSPTIHYRTWNGAAWSSDNTTSSPLTGNPTFIKLVPKPASNEVLLFVIDDNNAIAAMVWNGSSWGNKVILETAAPSSSTECADAAYEAGTGRCMVVWSHNASASPQHAIWDGSTWSGATTMGGTGAAAQWIHIAPDPSGNKLMLGVQDAANKVNVAIWSGSAWGSYLQVENNAATAGSRCFDVTFEPRGTRGLIAYGRAANTTPRFRTYDGNLWGAETSGPTLPGTPFLIQLTPSGGGSEVMALMNCSGGQNRLEFMRWNGNTFVNTQELEPNVSGPAGAEVFMIPDEPPINVPRLIQAWAESAPP